MISSASDNASKQRLAADGRPFIDGAATARSEALVSRLSQPLASLQMRKRTRGTWATVKASLERMDRPGLVGVIRDLYEAGNQNRRFLHARFVSVAALDEYRSLVRAAVFPDPLSRRPVRLRDGTAAIKEYKRATGDLAGTVDLMLEFVEAGTEQAADLRYGDDAYFAALELKLRDVLGTLDALPELDRGTVTARLVKLGKYQDAIGWGYGDFLGDVAARAQARGDRSSRTRGRPTPSE